MSKQKTWMRDADGRFALIEDDTERPSLEALGWATADEPTDTDHAWAWHEGIEQPGQIAYGARDYWEARGWVFGPPPAPVDLTKDPALVDQAPAAKPKPKPEPKTSGKPATGADNVKEH